MPLKIVFLRPQNWSRLKPYYSSTITAVKVQINCNLSGIDRAIRVRCGYGFETCDANIPRSVKSTNLAKHRASFFLAILPVGSQELVLKVPKRGQFHAAIRMTRKCCDSYAQVSRAAKQGGFKRGGFPIWTCPSFFCPFLSFLGLSRFF